MMNLEETICDDLYQMSVDIIECQLKANKAISFEDGYMGVDLDGLTQIERNGVLAHEAGHYISGAFYHVYSPLEIKTRVEYRARKASFERYLAFEKLNAAVCDGICTVWELAEYFDLPEQFISRAVDYYTRTKGMRFGNPEEQLEI